MLRSLFSGVSGLRNHQVRMDVIGNNVSNVNTVAFKQGRVTFKEGFTQLLQGASRPPGDQGGINPIQIGLGTQIGAVDTMFTQGNIETTGLNTDLAIQGDSFFVVRKGDQSFYTRSGNFQLDADGRLVSPTNGFVVQGRMAVGGQFSDGITDIRLPFGQKAAAKPTSETKLAGNLDASAAVMLGQITNAGTTPPTRAAVDPMSAVDRALPENDGAFTETAITVYDSVGTKHDLKMVLWKTAQTSAGSEWTVKVDDADLLAAAPGGAAITGGNSDGTYTLKFDTNGVLIPGAAASLEFTPTGAEAVKIALDFGSGVNGIASYATSNTAVLRDQNGYTAGTLESFSVDRSGTITGSFSNGTNEPLGQIVLADFNNPSGLLRTGDNMYGLSGNSGGAVLGYANEGSQSAITSGALEMSNVDLAQEFTSMIVAQRGYQANSRVITTSDEMLQELMSLKR